MDLEILSKVVGNVGLPCAILLYLVWRLDKFLTFLCNKLSTYNQEFQNITYALTDIVKELKEIKNNFNHKKKS